MSPKREELFALQAKRHSVFVDDAGADSEQVSAGTIPWRVQHGRLEVLLIHRVQQRDWSWPKGRTSKTETLPECAVRETEEEAGLTIRLGIPLPTVRSSRRETWYWAAEADRQEPAPDKSEVDKVLWLAAEEARKKLSAKSDRIPLDALIEAHQRGQLATRPLIILRHAKATPRSKWSRAESDRPLAATGRRQALSVANLLLAWRPSRVNSSPWKRCMETVLPYIQKLRLKIRRRRWLTESAATKDPQRTQQKFSDQLAKKRSLMICTHRPVLPVLIEALRKITPEDVAAGLPQENPYLAPGAAIIAQQAVGTKAPKIVSIEVYDAFDD